MITTAFIGHLVAGLPGGLIAAAATVLPCYVFTVVPAPFMRRYGQSPAIVTAVKGVTAGAIVGAVVVLGATLDHRPVHACDRRNDLPRALEASKIPEPAVIAIAAALGLLIAALRG